MRPVKVLQKRRGHTRPNSKLCIIFLVAVALAFTAAIAGAQDSLPSWNDGPTKMAIMAFVGDVTRKGSPSYVAPAERIATFDNDGTFWAEAKKSGWVVISMKNDWKVIFPFDGK